MRKRIPTLLDNFRNRILSHRAFEIQLAYLIILSFLLFATWPHNQRVGDSNRPITWLILIYSQLLLVTYLSSALTSGDIPLDEEDESEMPIKYLSPTTIVFRRITSPVLEILVLLISSLPLAFVTAIVTGTTVNSLFIVYILLFAFAIIFGTIGTFCSIMLQGPLQASLTHYALLIFFLLGTALLDPKKAQMLASPPAFRFLYLNPFAALNSIFSRDSNMIPLFGHKVPFWIVSIMYYFILCAFLWFFMWLKIRYEKIQEG